VRVALYARVSTDRQERQRTIGSQLEALEAKAAAEGWKVELSCVDDGYSGARLDRPGLDQLRDAAAARTIDAVVVLCPDRLARNYVHQALVFDELARFGVSIVFVEGGVADDPHGRLVAQIQAAVAEFERTKIVERNRRGKLWRARQGEVVSNNVPYGYRRLPASDGLPARLEIRQDEASVVRQIFEWHANQLLSTRRIAIRLMEAGIPSPKGGRTWHPASIASLLRHKAYAGTLYYNRRADLPEAERMPRHTPGHRPVRQSRPQEEWIAIAVPSIVELDTWSRSQARHEENARLSRRHVGDDRYLLRYLVRCGECGQARGARRRAKDNGSEYLYYRCPTGLPKHLVDKPQCAWPCVRADELDELVWNEVVRRLRHPELIVVACSMPLEENLITDARRQLRDLRSQEQRLVDAYQAGAISLGDLESRRQPLGERIHELEEVLTGAGRRPHGVDLKLRVETFSRTVAEGMAAMTFAQKQQLVRTVVEKVVVYGDRVELCFKIPIPPSSKECQRRRAVSGQLRWERQDPPEARLPQSRPSVLLWTAHRGRAQLCHAQGPRLH